MLMPIPNPKAQSPEGDPPGAQAQSAHLQGMPPSLNPAAWRELDWARAKKLESTSGRQRKKNLDRKKKQAIIGIGCPRSPHLTLQSAALRWKSEAKKAKVEKCGMSSAAQSVHTQTLKSSTWDEG